MSGLLWLWRWKWTWRALWVYLVIMFWLSHTFWDGVALGAVFIVGFQKACDWLFRVNISVDNGRGDG